MSSRGFTLLEMLIATLIMGIAVAGLLSNISTSLHHASNLSDYDRAALVAKRMMDGLLLDTQLPKGSFVEGKLEPASGGLNGGWKARVTLFEAPPGVRAGMPVLERLELEIRWTDGARNRTLVLEGFRRAALTREALAGQAPQP